MLKKYFQQDSEPAFDLSGFLEKKYRDLLARKQINFDEAQIKVLEHLQAMLDQLMLMQAYQQKSPLQKKLMSPPEPCQSLYIFGDVGRGKSMLMALFYDACPLKEKRRVHFNTFMLEVHAFIHLWQQKRTSADALSAFAKQIRDSALVLCFDEFHVTDIADAMILGRLFSKLFELGVIVVITSNRHPSDLYQGGLQREQFLFFIKVLLGSAKVLELVAKSDYRLSFQPTTESTYIYPLDERARDIIEQRHNELTGFSAFKPGVLQVFGRPINLHSVHEKILLTTFEELCVQPLGSADYLEIANHFDVIILAEIPMLSSEKRNEAKRFVTLIDVLYENKIKLVCSAEVPADALYTEGDGAFEFRRTASRLIEMQSASYQQGKDASP
jgi:cell division protein ZapE